MNIAEAGVQVLHVPDILFQALMRTTYEKPQEAYRGFGQVEP
jgi:hypothetical protein